MKNYFKSFNPAKYLFAIITLYVLYTYIIPIDNLPESIQNIYIFIASGIFIVIIYDLTIAPLFKSSKEYYNSESSATVSESSVQTVSESSDSESKTPNSESIKELSIKGSKSSSSESSEGFNIFENFKKKIK